MTKLTKKDLKKLAKRGLEGAAAGEALRIALIRVLNSSKGFAKLSDSFKAAEIAARKVINSTRR